MTVKHRRLTVAAAALTGATLFGTSNFACESFIGESALKIIDTCFVFDCGNGIFGGTIQPCITREDANGEFTPSLFLDCPDVNGN